MSGDHLGFAAGGFDLFGGRARELVDADGERDLELAVAEHLDRRRPLGEEPRRAERLGGDLGSGLQAVQTVDVDRPVLDPEDVRESALGHTAVERHLAALETALGGVAAPRLLALLTAPRGLPRAGARAAADALPVLPRPGCGLERAQLHGLPQSFTTTTRCGTLRSIPRIGGLSGTSRTRPIFSSPSARSVAFWVSSKPMPLRICLIVIVFFLVAAVMIRTPARGRELPCRAASPPARRSAAT